MAVSHGLLTPLLLLPQIMAAVRCKRSKWWFLARTFFGKDWQEHELFHPPTDVRDAHLPCVSCALSHAAGTSAAAWKPHTHPTRLSAHRH